MNARVLAAGWPFAGLLAFDALRAEVSSAAPVRGLIVEADSQGGILVLDSEDVTCPLTADAATRCYGVDGYPIAREDIHVGDMIEAVQEKNREERVTTKILVLRLASYPSPGAC
jgi:hypothetical protein